MRNLSPPSVLPRTLTTRFVTILRILMPVSEPKICKVVVKERWRRIRNFAFGVDRTRQDKTRQDRTRQDKTRQDRRGEGRIDKIREGKRNESRDERDYKVREGD